MTVIDRVEIHEFDFEARNLARDGLAQDVRRQRNAMGLVECPADSLGDPGAAIGDAGPDADACAPPARQGCA